MHYYPGLDYRKIRRMTLRQVMDAIDDIPFVHPMLKPEDSDKGHAAPRQPVPRPVHPNGEITLYP